MLSMALGVDEGCHELAIRAKRFLRLGVLQVLATTRRSVRSSDPHFHAVIVNVDDIESSELTKMFKTSLKVIYCLTIAYLFI